MDRNDVFSNMDGEHFTAGHLAPYVEDYARDGSDPGFILPERYSPEWWDLFHQWLSEPSHEVMPYAEWWERHGPRWRCTSAAYPTYAHDLDDEYGAENVRYVRRRSAIVRDQGAIETWERITEPPAPEYVDTKE